MTRLTRAALLLLALPLSTIVAACGGDEDTADRRALEREALERDLDLALQPDSAPVQAELNDVPLAEEPAPEIPPVVTPPPAAAEAPKPARREAPRRTEPRREEPRREPAPASRPAPEPERPRYVTRRVPAGTTFAVSLNEELTSGKGVGETFSATLTEPLVDENGNTVIPAGASVRGRVTAADARSISVAFTSIASGGETYPIDASVVSSFPVRRVNRDSRVEQGAKVASGAAVGAVLGRVIGKDRRSAVAGAAVGAAAGTAVAIGTASVEAVASPGSTATVRLDSGVSVRRER